MKQYQEINQNWTAKEKLDIWFGLIFNQVYQSFISGRETG